MFFNKYHHYCLLLVLCCCYVQSFYDYQVFSYQKDWQQQQVVVNSNSNYKESSLYQETYIAPDLALPKNHVSSISPLPNEKSVACAWYGGSDEGHHDVCIYYSIYKNKEWSKPFILMSTPKCSQELQRYIRKIGNPVIFRTQDRLWLFYASVSMGGWAMTSLNCTYSDDNGVTWSQSQKLYVNPFLNISSNVKNKPILLSNNTFLLPIYHENIKKASSILWVSIKNNKIKYQVRRIAGERNTLQPTILYQENKSIVAYFRDRNKEAKLLAKSEDMGITWTDVEKTSLPNPNSGFDMLRISEKKYLGIINYSPVERDNLVIIETLNKGQDWKVIHYLETPIPEQEDTRLQAIGRKEHYYQYPSIEYHNGNYHITYTYFNKIKHVMFNDSWLKEIRKN